jgi:hypothetical protein
MNLRTKLHQDYSLLKSLFTKQELLGSKFISILITILTFPILITFLVQYIDKYFKGYLL